ncbi:MAG: hypothetical protein IRY99_16805, partial [Isosphaeraceae bacterium]|nr:hypothetical protein [Isosphaeraceae bacterium]
MNLGCWVVVLALVMATEPAARRAVVVTTDCGASFDDQWALTHLALCPEFDLKGIVTTHAPNLPPPAAEASARAARGGGGPRPRPPPPPPP